MAFIFPLEQSGTPLGAEGNLNSALVCDFNFYILSNDIIPFEKQNKED